ncbi:unnamed protein product [Agarophyton chilense]
MDDANQETPIQSPRSPLSSEINSLSEYQLKKLTRTNTRKNVGGRKKRFFSQLERVCRRLELLNVNPKVNPSPQNHSLDAIPVVNPDGSSFTAQSDRKEIPLPETDHKHPQGARFQEQTAFDDIRMPRRAQTPRFAKDTPFARSDRSHTPEPSVSPTSSTKDDDFEIEPASVYAAHEGIPSTTLTTKSFRSVRISTEVTILDYGPQNKKGETTPLSISTMRRTEHPSRNGKCFHLRGRLANDNQFSRAMSAMERNNLVRKMDNRHPDDPKLNSESAMGAAGVQPRNSNATHRLNMDSSGAGNPVAQKARAPLDSEASEL